jgi:hypothetical protein
MSGRSTRYGRNGAGRQLSYGDGKKVTQGGINSAYRVDTVSLRQSAAVLESGDVRTLTRMPGPGGMKLVEGEMAFKVLGGGDRVRTALNGLDARLVAAYPDDPEMVRALLAEMIQPMGIVEEDARTDKNEPKVTLRIGGTHPMGAPGSYNFGDLSNPKIVPGAMVVFDVPNLEQPIQYGNPQSGVPMHKIKLVPRAADKRTCAARIQTIVSRVNHDPVKFKEALTEHHSLAHSWMKISSAIITSYKTALLMGIDLLIKEGVLEVAEGQGLDGPNGDTLASEDAVARIAEYIALLKEGRFSAQLSAAQRAKWKKIEFELRNRMMPTPNPQSGKYNVAHEFGFRMEESGTYSSKGRVNGTGAPKNDALGKLLQHSIAHFPQMLQSVVTAVYSERKNAMGVALTEPSNEGTGLFQLYLQPHGGMYDLD